MSPLHRCLLAINTAATCGRIGADKMNFLLYNRYDGALRRERLFRDRTHPLEFSDNRLKQLFRFERQNLLRLINSVAPILENPTQRNNSLPSSIQVCAGLLYLSTGSFQSCVGEAIGVSQETVSRCYWKFVSAVIQQHSQTITFGNTENIQTAFHEISRLPQICGAIDCTHIRIVRPSGAFFPDEYINRKGWCSINVQAVCDRQGRFLDVAAEWPGSTHDSRIFKNSNLFNRLCSGEFNDGYLVGDGGYPLYSFLMTPYRNPADGRQLAFNRSLSRARVNIEMAFGRVKRRFACLYRTLHVPLPKVCCIITCCFILHNFAMMYNDPDFDDVLPDHDQPIVNDVELNNDDLLRQQGARRRQQLTQLFN